MMESLGRVIITVPVRERRELRNAAGESIGFSSVLVGTREVEIEIRADVLGLAQTIGQCAAKNKSGKSVEAGGRVEAVVVRKAGAR